MNTKIEAGTHMAGKLIAALLIALGFRRKAQLCGFLCLRGVLDAVGLLASLLGRLASRGVG